VILLRWNAAVIEKRNRAATLAVLLRVTWRWRGARKDKLAETAGVIAFDMETAGVWENLLCIVVKGVCGYADSHKKKAWQEHAALATAACTKAVLEQWSRRGRRRRIRYVEPRSIYGESGLN
jgi:nucleoside phosphorylase